MSLLLRTEVGNTLKLWMRYLLHLTLLCHICKERCLHIVIGRVIWNITMIEVGMDVTIISGSIGCHGNKLNACTYDSATFGKDMTPSTLLYSNFPSFSVFFCFFF